MYIYIYTWIYLNESEEEMKVAFEKSQEQRYADIYI